MFIDIVKAGFVLSVLTLMFKAIHEMKREMKSRFDREDGQDEEILKVAHRVDLLEQKTYYELKANSDSITQLENYLTGKFDYKIRGGNSEH
ncbi:MAG: hypothetical protein F6K61_21540 [Sphaerospermopsis sp. SIO1G1]|nr:hypothetical protein [Sphaerospermopsis sp. SIO1G1]